MSHQLSGFARVSPVMGRGWPILTLWEGKTCSGQVSLRVKVKVNDGMLVQGDLLG